MSITIRPVFHRIPAVRPVTDGREEKRERPRQPYARDEEKAPRTPADEPDEPAEGDAPRRHIDVRV